MQIQQGNACLESKGRLGDKRVADFTGWLIGLSCLCIVIPALREWLA